MTPYITTGAVYPMNIDGWNELHVRNFLGTLGVGDYAIMDVSEPFGGGELTIMSSYDLTYTDNLAEAERKLREIGGGDEPWRLITRVADDDEGRRVYEWQHTRFAYLTIVETNPARKAGEASIYALNLREERTRELIATFYTLDEQVALARASALRVWATGTLIPLEVESKDCPVEWFDEAGVKHTEREELGGVSYIVYAFNRDHAR